jgi:peptide-methionine (R)-S-oxide reductase
VSGARHTGPMSDPTTDWTPPTEDELRERLTPLQFDVTQNAGTEQAFTGIYADEKRPGTYRCVVCGLDLFVSDTKYESGSGWPSFWKPIADDRVVERDDRSHGMVRTEAVCARCGAHLGHVFPDGPQPTGLRYCMNSASLDLAPADG